MSWTIVWTAALTLPALARAEPPLASQYQPNLAMDSCEATSRAAGFLVASQVRAGGEESLGWSWVVGGNQVAPNLTGLISLSLLEAHQAAGNEPALRAAWRYAEGRLAAEADLATPFKPDVELLARLSQATGDPVYLAAARELWSRVVAVSPDGRAEVARIARARAGAPALVGFDVALTLRAALALGEQAYAQQLAEEVIRRSAEWYLPAKDPRFSLVSAAALVPALERLDAARHAPVVARFRRDLLQAQQPSGAWLANETQPSAYAVMALGASPLADEREAAQRGLLWLRTSMLQAGSYAAFNDFMPEPFVGEVISAVHAEALSALAADCQRARGK